MAIASTASLARFLSEAYRVLNPGGYLLVDTLCGPVTAGRIRGYDAGSGCALVNGIATRYFGLPDEIKADLESRGFQILSCRIEREASHGNVLIEATKQEARPGF